MTMYAFLNMVFVTAMFPDAYLTRFLRGNVPLTGTMRILLQIQYMSTGTWCKIQSSVVLYTRSGAENNRPGNKNDFAFLSASFLDNWNTPNMKETMQRRNVAKT
jgi:hypothetical protein